MRTVNMSEAEWKSLLRWIDHKSVEIGDRSLARKLRADCVKNSSAVVADSVVPDTLKEMVESE